MRAQIDLCSLSGRGLGKLWVRGGCECLPIISPHRAGLEKFRIKTEESSWIQLLLKRWALQLAPGSGGLWTGPPGLQPSNPPTLQPSNPPTFQPSNPSTLQPSNLPTLQPARPPALQASNPSNPPALPTLQPSNSPALLPLPNEPQTLNHQRSGCKV